MAWVETRQKLQVAAEFQLKHLLRKVQHQVADLAVVQVHQRGQAAVEVELMADQIVLGQVAVAMQGHQRDLKAVIEVTVARQTVPCLLIRRVTRDSLVVGHQIRRRLAPSSVLLGVFRRVMG